jgi:hypothetical protein
MINGCAELPLPRPTTNPGRRSIPRTAMVLKPAARPDSDRRLPLLRALAGPDRTLLPPQHPRRSRPAR